MADAAHGAGLDVLGYTTQAHFLMNCGVLDRLGDAHTLQRANEVQRLLSEAEMGELFKVLAVGRDVGGPLIGFTRGDRTDRL
jgi:SAM-dependent MidA family methyltransferase